MKKISKRVLSLLLALLMLATIAPLNGFVALAGTNWQLIATTDFTESTWTKYWSDGSYNAAHGGNFKATSDGTAGTYMTWDSVSYGEQSYSRAAGLSGDAAWQPCSNTTDGVIVSDGYLHLSGYYKNGIAQTKTPITGQSAFKIDVQFKYMSDHDRDADDGFFKISNYNKFNSAQTMNKTSADTSYNNTTWFCQGINGKQYYLSTSNSNGACTTATSNAVSSKSNLSTNSSKSVLRSGNIYHYMMSYSHDTVTSWVEDNAGNTIVNLGSVYNTGFKDDLSYITNICLGTTGGNYLKNIAYQSVKIYKGVSNDSSYEMNENRDKYLFSYFTGNDTEDLHLAVSDDGYHFEALNGNEAIWDSGDLPASPDVYPKTFLGNDVSNVYSNHEITGHVRDPYMFMAEDGSYYVLATDLQSSKGWSNNSELMVWHVDDPTEIETTDPWFIETQRFFNGDGDTTIANVNRAWAPEAIWDPYENAYMLHFGVSDDGSGIYTRLYYTYTTDFKTFTDPQVLLQVPYSNIDANINYDGQKYVMTFKKEGNEDNTGNSARMYRCTSERPNGPYTNPEYLTTSYAAEGGETYPITRDDGSLEYALIMDDYGASSSSFSAFVASTMTSISTSSAASDFKINHLSPRHGSVVRITTSEYNALVRKYGKETYDAAAFSNGDEVNEHLIARYFTTSDVTYNAATQEAGELTNASAVSYQYVDGRNTAYFPSSSDTNCEDDSSGYMYVNATDIGTGNPFNGLDINSGITFDWYAKQSSYNNNNGNRIFDFTDGECASVTWAQDGSGGHNDIAYLFASANRQVGAANHGNFFELNSARDANTSSQESANWHRYTVSVSAGYIHYFIDGELISECPKTSAAIVDSWLTRLKTGRLYFGISSYTNDKMFNGYISDFRIYDTAIAPKGMEMSIDKLENPTINESANDFYDPMEAKTIGSKTYTDYTPGTVDTSSEYGKVLSFGSDGVSGAGQTAHDTYVAKASDTGYVISFWYNPGSSKVEETVFHIGDGNSYINFKENEILDFKYGGTKFRLNWAWCTSSGRGDGLIGDGWHHYTLRIVPAGTSDKLYFYVDGVYADSLDTKDIVYNSSFSDNNYIYCWGDATIASGDTMSKFLANVNSDVNYGKGSGYTTATTGMIDDFRIYTELHSADDVYKHDAKVQTGATLDDAIEIYEHRISDMATRGYSAMYTNLSAAYTAYKAAIAAKATADTSDDATALANLNTALVAMTKFVPYTGTNTPSGTNYAPEEGYYANLIYTGGATNGAHAWDEDAKAVIYQSHGVGGWWKYGCHAYLYYPEAVLLYDGVTDPVLPVMAAFKNTDDRYSVNILYLTDQMDDFDLTNDRWQGYTDTTIFEWPSGGTNQMTIDPNNESETYGMNTINEDVSNDQNIYRTVKNGFRYSPAVAPTAAYTCISQTGWAMRSQYEYSSSHHQINTNLTNATPDIDIINYKKLTDALSNAANSSTNKRYLADLDKYQKNGLEGIFAAFDSATSLDPNTGSTYFDHTYTYSIDMDAAALQCGNDINSSVYLLGDIRITNDSASYVRLCNAITAYEAKMAAMTTVNTNLEPAYKAYLIAVEYKDAYEFGQRSSFENPTLGAAAMNLENETAKMKPYTDITWDGKAAFNNNVIPDSNAMAAGNTDTAGFNNVLYCSLTTKWTNERNWNGGEFRYGIPQTSVIVVDGRKTPTLPCGYTLRKNGNNHDIYYIRLYDSNYPFELRNYWKGYNNFETTYHYNTSGYDGTSAGYEENYTYSSSTRNSVGHSNTGTARQWVNKMFYTGTGASTSNSNNYTDYYNLYDNIRFGMATTGKRNNPSNEWVNDNSSASEQLGTVYTINYKPLYDKIGTIDIGESGIDVTQYQEGGLSTFFANIDKLTKIDPNEYDGETHPNGYTYSVDPADAVSECVADIYDAMYDTQGMDTDIDNCTADSQTSGDIYTDGALNPISNNNGAYTNLKIAITEANTIAPKEQGCIILSYWNAYKTALANARTAMSNIANADSSNRVTGKAGYTESEINAIATALHNAINGTLDLDNSSHPLKFSYQVKGTHDAYFQCHTNNLHVLCDSSDPHFESETLEYADMTAYDALNMVYGTLDKTKYTDFDTIRSGKETFDEVKTDAAPAGVTAAEIVDTGVRALLNSINEANDTTGESVVTRTFDVTFKVYTIDGDGTVSSSAYYTDSSTYDDVTYGTVATFTANTETVISALDGTGIDADNFTVQKWTVNGVQVHQGAATNTVSVYVQDNAEVIAYVLKPMGDEDKEPVYIKNLSGRIMYTIPVNDNTTISYNSSTPNVLTIGGTNYNVPNSLNWTINGWTLKGGYYDVSTSYTDKTVAQLKAEAGIGSGDHLTFYPKKVNNVSPSATYTFTMDRETVVANVPYDYRLTVASSFEDTETEKAYAIVFYNSDHDIFVPVVYLDDDVRTYSFYANRSMDFYTLTKKSDGYYLKANGLEGADIKITDEELLFYLDYRLPMVYAYSEPVGDNWGTQTITEGSHTTIINYSNKWVTRAAFTKNVGGTDFGDVTITECGTLRTTQSLDVNTLVVENVGKSGYSITMKSNPNFIELSNQYSYSLSTTSTALRTVLTRSYVKYSYTYRGTKIDAVAYGPICQSNYGEYKAS